MKKFFSVNFWVRELELGDRRAYKEDLGMRELRELGGKDEKGDIGR